MDDSAHALQITQNMGNRTTNVLNLYRKLVRLLRICSISMTEFCEAVAYAIYCVGLEGLHTSLKPGEALIYLYDGRMVELSWQAAVGSTIDLT